MKSKKEYLNLAINSFLKEEYKNSKNYFLKSSLLGNFKCIEYLTLLSNKDYGELSFSLYKDNDIDLSLKNKLLDISISHKYFPSYIEKINNYDLSSINDVENCLSLIDEALSFSSSFKDKQYLKRKRKEVVSLLTFNDNNNMDKRYKNDYEKISLFDSLKITVKNTFSSVKDKLNDELEDLIKEFKDLPDKLVSETKKSLSVFQEEKVKREVISLVSETNYNKLSEDSKSYLITGYYLYTSSNLNNIVSADYSSIVVTLSKLIENEFKRRYYHNYLAYLKLNNYPLNEYPNQLLYINNNKLSIRKENSINLGNIEYLLNGERNKLNQEEVSDYNYDRIHDLTILYIYNKEEVFTDFAITNYKESISSLISLLVTNRELYRNLSCHDKKVCKSVCDNFISSLLLKDNELKKVLDLFKK